MIDMIVDSWPVQTVEYIGLSMIGNFDFDLGKLIPLAAVGDTSHKLPCTVMLLQLMSIVLLVMSS